MQERLDKYISNLGIASRSVTRKFVREGFAQVNDVNIFKPDFKVSEGDIINFNEEIIPVKKGITILLHKPAGYVSSDIDDGHHFSYKKLLKNCPYKDLVKIAGRLDVDTEGLLVLCSDGKKIHQIISPKKGKEKIYIADIEKKILEQDIKKLENPMEIDNYTTLGAKIERIGDKKIQISVKEGKFHQIKKMLESVNNKVLCLKRISVGKYKLGDLKKGEWKYVN